MILTNASYDDERIVRQSSLEELVSAHCLNPASSSQSLIIYVYSVYTNALCVYHKPCSLAKNTYYNDDKNKEEVTSLKHQK